MMGNSANQPPTTEYTLQGRCRLTFWNGYRSSVTDIPRIQVLCAFSRPNGTAMNAIVMLGKSRSRR